MSDAEEKIAIARLSVYSITLIVVMKLVAGFMMMSVAVISEAIHSSMDLLAALIARFSVKKSAEPADQEHHYGHGKYENLSGMVEGVLIFVAAILILYEALNRLIGEEREVEFLIGGIIVMAVSTVLNLYVGLKLRKVSKKTDSLALEADSYHLLTDVGTSVGVLIALVLIQFTGYQWLDPAIAIIVAMIIIHAAYDITRRSTEGLLDKSLPEAELKLVEAIIRRHESDVLNFHKLRARKMGSDRQIDLHLVVPRGLSVKQGHDLVDDLERDIKKELPHTTVVVHIEPCDEMCERCKMSPTETVSTPECPDGEPSNCVPKE